MKALYVAWKDIQISLKDRGSLVALFLLPLLFIVVASGAIGAIGEESDQPDVRIPLPVVNLDGGRAAQELIQGIDAAGGVYTELHAHSEALSLLQEEKIAQVLIIPAGFSPDLEAGRSTTLRLVNHPKADRQKAEAVRLVIEGVASDMALQTQILASLTQMGDMMADAPPEYLEAFSVERAQAQARSQFERASGQPLVDVRQRVPTAAVQAEGDDSPLANYTAVPGFAVLFVFLTAQATAQSIYEEKKVGSFRRLLAAPLSKASLLAGKVLPNFVTALLQMAVIFAFGLFGLPLLGFRALSLGHDPLAMALVVAAIALCSSAMGLVIAAIARTENQVSGLSNLFLWIMAVIGGCIIPLFALEMVIGPLPRVVPQYWANRALENLMVRGLGLADVTVEIGALLAFTAAFFVVGLWRFEFK